MSRRKPYFLIAVLLFCLAATYGCGSNVPFDFVPVQGKVTYDDGSLIKADSVLVMFSPIAADPTAKMVPPGGQTYANVADGTFSAISSYRPNDGLAVGRHKVVVISFKNGPNGNPAPSPAVPEIYRKTTTTPLEIEVNSPNQNIELKVSKK